MKNRAKWLLIKDNISEPFMHFAVEEAILRLTDENYTFPTLRIRQSEPSVWIGYYQSPEEDVDVDFCLNNNLKIVRRLNSGGAVYQNKGTFCYSAFFNKAQFFSDYQINHTDDLYSLFGKVIIQVCHKYGIEANLSPVNDITVNQKKIYGSAQLDWYSAFVHSGSVLVDVDKEMMQKALKPSDLKFIDKGFKTVKERVANLSELGLQKFDIHTIQSDFIEAFQHIFNIDLIESELTKEQKLLAETLYEQKYATPQWTFKKQQPYTKIVSTKIQSGVISLKCNLLNNIIQSFEISGDFLQANHNAIQNLKNNCKNKTIEQAVEIIRKSELNDHLKNGITKLFHQIIN